VGLVHHEQEVVREVVQQAVGGRAGGPPVDVPGVVLDPVAVAHLLHHLEVVRGAHPQALGLEQLVLGLQLLETLAQLVLDRGDRLAHARVPGHVVGGREDVHLRLLPHDLAGEGVEGLDGLDLVPEELDAHRELLVHGDDLHRVPAHPERAAVEVHVVAHVLHLHELAQQGVPVHLPAAAQGDHLLDVLLGRAEAVDAGDGGHHHHVPACEEGVGGGVAQPLHLLVDGGVLLDEGVRLRDVGLGLVVVVVGDEVLDRVVRQQLTELVGQLCRERLVLHHHEGGPLQPLDQPRGRGRLAGAGGAQEDDVLLPRLDALGELRDGGGLVA